MALEKEFFDNFNILEKYKQNLELKDFFDTVHKLEQIGEEIVSETSKTSSILCQQAVSLTKKLEDKKEEIAYRTKTQKEFDAVFECIDYLDKHFSTLN
jgi:hypothetical protein